MHNTEGNDNTATGFQALFNNTTGVNNTAIGVNALGGHVPVPATRPSVLLVLIFYETAGSRYDWCVGFLNTPHCGDSKGVCALFSNIAGNTNTAIGFAALQNNIGNNNTGTGASALTSNTTGGDNTRTRR